MQGTAGHAAAREQRPGGRGRSVKVTDGVARRVPILTGREGPATANKEIKKLQREAATTKLAMYQIFLADFKIPRKLVTGEFAAAFFTPTPKPGKVAATLAVVPTKNAG